MANDFDKALKAAMLQYVIDNRYDWGDDEPDEDPPVEVTGWEEQPYVEATCDTCGPEWPRVYITYRTKSGVTDTHVVEEDFGEFIRELTRSEE
ncbi:hypothetical protein [Bifidobacterium sp. SO1]|uniref:hypothetical protein n=1 Tax=Bifidobacterium sp. SO1 TaxID=2809029 RepID=UPI001BDD2FB7|nr:hypothetical protein [Bifidobacterium sp. SO1]MBT1162582.1 hypothetical protein [Bifidobacterium sp. SO1]